MNNKKVYGPDLYKRNEHGLLENVDYIFNQDGSVDWRAMIRPEFLYPNKDWFSARGKELPSSPEGLDDKQLLIMLGGIKELARLRGFRSVSFETKNEDNGYVTAKCKIEWIENYETGGIGVLYEDVANATLANTDSFCAKFLETIACNRAFVRCVRNYLNVHIVGADEIDKSKGANNSSSVEYDSAESSNINLTPSAMLEKAVKEKTGSDSFDQFKNVLREFWKQEKYRNEAAKEWTSFNDIPAKESRKLLSLIKTL
jgi:hypothetical protein